jgi:hypothetical protein
LFPVVLPTKATSSSSVEVIVRIFNRGRNTIITDRPYQGGPGAKLYVAAGNPTDIIYRAARAYDPKHLALQPVVTRDVSVATVNSPTTRLSYTLPAALLNTQLSCQVRTFAGDYENETIYRPRIVSVDGGGTPNDSILGTAVVISIEKRDNGGVLVTFAYTASANGLQPDTFALLKTSGGGTVADSTIPATDRVQSIETDGLADGVAYGFNLQARSGAITVVLGSLTFTADTTGPSDPVNVIAVPR